MKNIKRTFAVLMCLALALVSVFPSFAEGEEYDDASLVYDGYSALDATSYYSFLPRVADLADVLSDDEEISFEETLGELREKHQMDFVIVTVMSLEGKTIQAFADDYYDYNGYGEGYGFDRDGVLLLLNLGEDRGVYISTRGSAIYAFTDYGIECILDNIIPYLSDSDYVSAFDTFVRMCDEYTLQYESGTPVDINNTSYGEDSAFPWFKNIVISIAVGFVIALIIVLAWKSKLKSVRHKTQAGDYLVDGSLDITQSRDTFLYVHVDKIKKPEPSSSSGGSSTHTSSSGATHGGGGRSF